MQGDTKFYNKLKIGPFPSFIFTRGEIFNLRLPQIKIPKGNDVNQGFPTWGDLRGIKVVVTWVHLHDAIDVIGDRRAKRLRTILHFDGHFYKTVTYSVILI